MPWKLDPIDHLIGKRFGSWTLLHDAGNTRDGKYDRYVICRCDCGAEKLLYWPNVKFGKSKSCGCAGRVATTKAATRHGGVGTPEYRTWSSMLTRCGNPKCQQYPNYGGRGITVCERWRYFDNFREDLGLRPTPNHSLDRIDPNGNYEPSNCRWATQKEQANNLRKSRFIEFNGRRQTLAQWSNELGIGQSTLFLRIRAGWPIERALTEPVHEQKRPNTPKQITLNGITDTIAGWSRRTGIKRTTIEARLARGWPIERALS